MSERSLEVTSAFVPLDFDAPDLIPPEPDQPIFTNPHTGKQYPLALEALALGEALGLFRRAPIEGETPAATLSLPVAEIPQPQEPSLRQQLGLFFESVRGAHHPRSWKLIGASALLAISGGALTAAWHHRLPEHESYERPDTPPANDRPQKN